MVEFYSEVIWLWSEFFVLYLFFRGWNYKFSFFNSYSSSLVQLPHSLLLRFCSLFLQELILFFFKLSYLWSYVCLQYSLILFPLLTELLWYSQFHSIVKCIFFLFIFANLDRELSTLIFFNKQSFLFWWFFPQLFPYFNFSWFLLFVNFSFLLLFLEFC